MIGDGWPPKIDIAKCNNSPKNYMTLAYYDGLWSTRNISGTFMG